MERVVKTKQKLSTWIFLAISLLINSFIIVQASLPGDISNKISNFVYSVFRRITNGNDQDVPSWKYDPSTEPVNPPATSFNFEFIEVHSGNDIKDKTYKAEVNEVIDIWVKQINRPSGGVTFTQSSTDESVATVHWESNHIKINCLKVGNARITLTAAEISHYIDLTIIAEGVINHNNTPTLLNVIRKGIGHFCLFLLDAVFTFLFLVRVLKDKKKFKLWHIILITVSIGLFVAILSEGIQHFIPGRYFTGTDILVDFSGYLFGFFLTWLVVFLVDRKKHKELENASNKTE